MKKFTILMAAIVLVCFSVPAMAVDWNFYGNARMATFYDSKDRKGDENKEVTIYSNTYPNETKLELKGYVIETKKK